jgi:hypothetical protein
LFRVDNVFIALVLRDHDKRQKAIQYELKRDVDHAVLRQVRARDSSVARLMAVGLYMTDAIPKFSCTETRRL